MKKFVVLIDLHLTYFQTIRLLGMSRDYKKKVLAKQKKGKERMKRFGKVDIPAEAFTVLLKRD